MILLQKYEHYENYHLYLQMLDYNLTGGHKLLLKYTDKTYRILMRNKQLTEENIRQVHLLGWALEMVSFSGIRSLRLKCFYRNTERQ